MLSIPRGILFEHRLTGFSLQTIIPLIMEPWTKDTPNILQLPLCWRSLFSTCNLTIVTEILLVLPNVDPGLGSHLFPEGELHGRSLDQAGSTMKSLPIVAGGALDEWGWCGQAWVRIYPSSTTYVLLGMYGHIHLDITCAPSHFSLERSKVPPQTSMFINEMDPPIYSYFQSYIVNTTA